MVPTAQNDPDVAALADQGDEGRRDGTRRLTGMWASKGDLRDGSNTKTPLNAYGSSPAPSNTSSPPTNSVWTPDEYEQWLGDLLERELRSDNEAYPARCGKSSTLVNQGWAAHIRHSVRPDRPPIGAGRRYSAECSFLLGIWWSALITSTSVGRGERQVLFCNGRAGTIDP